MRVSLDFARAAATRTSDSLPRFPTSGTRSHGHVWRPAAKTVRMSTLSTPSRDMIGFLAILALNRAVRTDLTADVKETDVDASVPFAAAVARLRPTSFAGAESSVAPNRSLR